MCSLTSFTQGHSLCTRFVRVMIHVLCCNIKNVLTFFIIIFLCMYTFHLSVPIKFSCSSDLFIPRRRMLFSGVLFHVLLSRFNRSRFHVKEMYIVYCLRPPQTRVNMRYYVYLNITYET